MKKKQPVRRLLPYTLHLSPFTFTVIAMLLSLGTQAQIKISALPTMSGTNPDSVWVPVVQGADTKKARGYTFKGTTTMIYPGAGIPLSTGSAWGTSITNNSANWNTAYSWGNHASLYPLLLGSYTNPGFVNTLAWTKITGAPGFLLSTTADTTFQKLITLTTSGTSGAATFNQSTGALNIPNYAAGGGGSGSGISALGNGYGLLEPNDSTYDVDTVLIQKKLTAGSNITIAGDGTISSSGGSGGTTIYETQTASGSTAFTFTTVPATMEDYMVFRNGVKLVKTVDYTTSGNIVTIPAIVTGDEVTYQRIK